MRDYSQILTGRGQGGQNRQQQNKQGQGKQGDGFDKDFSDTDTPVQAQGVNKRTKWALANSLGTSAEAARGLGISKRQVHRIVDTAYHGGGSGPRG